MKPVRHSLIGFLLATTAAGETVVAASITPPPPPQPTEPPREALEFLRPLADGAFGEPVTPRSPTVERAWRVTPEIVALAREPRHSVRLPLGDGRSQDFRMSAFEAREGFSFDDGTGQIIVSDDPTELSYYWHGQNGRDHLTLTVVRGRIADRVYTPAQRLTFNAFGPEQHYQRIDMGLLNRGRCAHGEIMHRLPGRPAEDQDGRTLDGRRESARHLDPGDSEDISGAPGRSTPLYEKKPTPAAERAKHQIKIDVIFYFTDVLAEAIDYDNIPEWNYTPGNIAVAEALLSLRMQAYIDEINQSLRNSGGLSHIEFRRKG